MSTRNERLVDHFLRAAGIVGIYVEPAKAGVLVGVLPAVSLDAAAGRCVLCCARVTYASHVLACATPKLAGLGVSAAVDEIVSVALGEGIGLTPLDTVISRARTAIHAVNEQIEAMRVGGGLRPINREFRDARARGEVAIYADFLHSKKIAMLDAMVRHTKIDG